MNGSIFEIISKEFCGDFEDSLYEYKTGSTLVKFFNSNFGYSDQYYSGFPTRWIYASERIKDLYNNGKINKFFSYIMSIEFNIQEKQKTPVEIVPFIEKLKENWNRRLRPFKYQLIQIGDSFELTKLDEDLELIGEGGFANVYLQKSTGLVIKKLKRENLLEENSKHRFKREFEITKSLSDIEGIIKVYDFNESEYFYVMEKCDSTLYDFLIFNPLSVEVKESIIIKILYIMAKVHNKNIIHRDISSNNIFLKGNDIKIADFGLGKNFDLVFSHQTKSTAQLGQVQYCPPEQLMMLGSTGKYSDVYSLGRLINFILTKSPNDRNHKYKLLVEKATSLDINSRYKDAFNMYENFIKIKKFIDDNKCKEEILSLIESKKYNDRTSMYISSLSSKDLCNNIINIRNFKYSLYHYFNEYPESILEVIKFIELDMDSQCNRFEDADNFADIANYILENNLSTFEVREKAAELLNHIAFYINRFYAQRLVESLIERGIEPMLEEILIEY
ncbi:TPA: serine/threonine-protein kinase [Streptococcus agalactiae]